MTEKRISTNITGQRNEWGKVTVKQQPFFDHKRKVHTVLLSSLLMGRMEGGKKKKKNNELDPFCIIMVIFSCATPV